MGEKVLHIDSTVGIVKLVGPKLEGKDKYAADGVLAHDGRIYFAPADALQVLCVHTEEEVIELVGPSFRGKLSYMGGGVRGHGRVYFAPLSASKVLCITPGTCDPPTPRATLSSSTCT